MIFMVFSAAVAAAFFVGSLVLLHWGRHLGLWHLKQEGTSSMAGLSTVEGAVFGLMGLLLAFTVSGALQRFDDRRQIGHSGSELRQHGLRSAADVGRGGGTQPSDQTEGLSPCSN